MMVFMVYWLYMLLVGPISRGYNRKIYTGYTKHLASRLTQHSGISNIRGARLTRKQPIELVYLEKFSSQKKAMKREWEFKHKSPLNQKKNKLALIKQFQEHQEELLNKINSQLYEYNQFLEGVIEILTSTEKEFKDHLESS
jgi:putative endonuclease